jgi:hypothetical protein
MEAARDLFEEVEIEVPEGIELPMAIQATATHAEAPAAEQPQSPAEEGVPAEAEAAVGEKEQAGETEGGDEPSKDK